MIFVIDIQFFVCPYAIFFFFALQNIRSPKAEDATKSTSDVGKESRDFFRRSPSTLCLGLIPPSPFDPMCDAIPVAEKPQLMDGVQVGVAYMHV